MKLNDGFGIRSVVGSMLLVVLVCAGNSACSKKPIPEPLWTYEPDGIEISYRADKMLNQVDNEAHTLLLIVYQLDSTNAFNKLSADQAGLETLLKYTSFDPSVKAMDRFIIQPGEAKTLLVNRAENSKWVGLVAGYYTLNPGTAAWIFKIPVKIVNKGVIMTEQEAQVVNAKVQIVLGRFGIEEVNEQ